MCRSLSTRWMLRAADQAALAVLLVVGVSAVLAWCLGHGGWSHLGELDRGGVRSTRFEVDVNRADWPELTLLPGIGATLSQRIVALRESEGPYHRATDLRRVRGIGPKTMERIRPWLSPMPDNGRN
jgi:competence protein ComEA